MGVPSRGCAEHMLLVPSVAPSPVRHSQWLREAEICEPGYRTRFQSHDALWTTGKKEINQKEIAIICIEIVS